MARKTPKTDWTRELTAKIMTALEEGPEAWRRQWASVFKYGIPYNPSTKGGRHYNGLNVWLLALQGHNDPRWYTFDQAMVAVGYAKNPAWKSRADTYKGIAKWLWSGQGDDPKFGVRKGEKGTKVFYWLFIEKWADANGNPVYKPSKEQKASGEVHVVGRFPTLKVYTVFNADQIDGLPSLNIPEVDVTAEGRYAELEALVENLGAKITHRPGHSIACYRPGMDSIELPAPGQFESIEAYWSTALHELVHWTGDKNRLDRDLSNRFGSSGYAMEELVAEIGATFLCAHYGIEGKLLHEGYIAHWLKVLGGDKYAIFKAASLAQKAADYIIAGGALSEDEDTSDVDVDEAADAQNKAA
jgi:antirestriction protein ArdC